MSEENKEIDFEMLQALLYENERWASLSVTIFEIASDNRYLVEELSLYDPQKTIPLLASLLTLPEYQTNCIRLEVISALAAAYCSGKKIPQKSDAARWFYEIGKSKCSIGEDPSEDVFVSLVQDESEDYKILEGVWESAGFYTQMILDVVSTMPDGGVFRSIKRSVKSLLVISDYVCEKSKLARYQLGSEEKHEKLFVGTIPSKSKLMSRVNIPIEHLKERDVDLKDLEPFMYSLSMSEELLQQEVGNSDLERRPLTMLYKNQITVVLPTALSIAIREFVINAIVDNNLSSSFDRALIKKYSHLLSGTPLLGGPLHAPAFWKDHGGFYTSSFGFKVDEGYFISYHLFQPSIMKHRYGGFKDVIVDDGSLTEVLQRYIDKSVEKFTKKDGFREGIAVLVGCGWGKGYATDNIDFGYSNWRFEHISAADLVRLSWLNGMSPGYFWRIQDGLAAIAQQGVNLNNVNGVLNLIGWVRENEGHFIPHSQLPEVEITPDSPLNVQIPINLLRQVRGTADSGLDRHSVEDPDGKNHKVQFESSAPLFPSESAKNNYVSITDLEDSKLTSVYEGSFKLWITVRADNLDDRDTEYHLWKMANEWLHRIGWELDKKIKPKNRKGSFRVVADFQDQSPSLDPGVKPEESFLISCCELRVPSGQKTGLAIFKKGFLEGFQIPENLAERLFVWNVVRAYLTLIGERNVECKAKSMVQEVVKNRQARSFHLFHAQNFIDYVRSSLPKDLVEIDPINDGIAKLGLGLKAKRGQRDLDGKHRITGKSKCKKFLERVVDILLSRLSSMLEKYERESTVLRIVGNCEKAIAEEDHWEKTSAAVIGLHGTNEKTMETCVIERSKFAGAAVASRVLIEIALCDCPLGKGNVLSDIELSKLVAIASLVIRYGGLSDAIKFNALPPDLYVSPLGDILFRDDFGDMVVQPMLSKASIDKYVALAPKQTKNYDDPNIVVSTKGNFESEFWDVWKEEMGFDLDEARNIIGVLEDYGIENHKAVFKITRSKALSLMASERLSQSSVNNFLKQFTLRTRDRWDSVPSGFLLEDIYPWKFGRRLSFVTRPILQIDNSQNPTLVISPGSLRKGFAYLVDGTFYGRFKQGFYQTSRMRNDWWGKASEGHSFNSEAADALKDAGWNVRENIGLPELFNEKLDKNYGDVDILAWRSDSNKVLVIECKDLSFARNYSEISALLSIFQGGEDRKGKGDKLKVHLIRVDLIKQKTERVKRFTGIPKLEIESCLAFSGIVPMQFAQIDALKNSTLGSIEDIIKKFKVDKVC